MHTTCGSQSNKHNDRWHTAGRSLSMEQTDLGLTCPQHHSAAKLLLALVVLVAMAVLLVVSVAVVLVVTVMEEVVLVERGILS